MALSSKNCLFGLFWAAVAIAVWSGSLVMLRLGVTTNLNAYDLTAIRFGVAALILVPVIVRQGFAIDRLGVGGLVLLVTGFGAPYILLVSLALKTAPAAAAGSLNPGVMAVASVFLGWAILGDRVSLVRIFGVMLILAGAVVVLGTADTVSTGSLILVGTGIMWAVYALTVRRAGIAALHATAIVAVGSAVLYLPVYFMILPRQIAAAPLPDVLAQAGFQGLLVSVFAVFAFNRSAELLGPVAGAALPALIPVVTVGLGMVVLGEPAGMKEIEAAGLTGAGVALILAGRGSIRGLWKSIRERVSAENRA